MKTYEKYAPGYRYAWRMAVFNRPPEELNTTAKLVASYLVDIRANESTGQINPSYATIAKDLGGLSLDTIKRAVIALERAGFLAMPEGRTPNSGRRGVVFVLTSPGAVVVMKPVQDRQKPQQNCRGSSGVNPCKPAREPLQTCNPHIRKEQYTEQKARARPFAHLHKTVERGSDRATAWNEWLTSEGLPDLDALPALSHPQGWDLPWAVPPHDRDCHEFGMAMRFIEWAMNESDSAERRRKAVQR